MTWLLSTTPDYNRGPSCGGEDSVEANLRWRRSYGGESHQASPENTTRESPTIDSLQQVKPRLAFDRWLRLEELQRKPQGDGYGWRPQSVNGEQECRSVDDRRRALAVERDEGTLRC